MDKIRLPFAFALLAAISACSGNDSGSSPPAPTPPEVRFDGVDPGATPLIQVVRLSGQGLTELSSISYVIEPRPATVSRPVRVSFSQAALRARGYLAADQLRLPVFGLYANHANAVTFNLQFTRGGPQDIARTLTTGVYVDPHGIYDRPSILRARAAGSALGFDFFILKSLIGSPVIVDTDGAVRWVGNGIENAIASIFIRNGFVIGDPLSTMVRRLELDGSLTAAPLRAAAYTIFHHNIDRGRDGLLGHFDTATDIESIVAEFTESGEILREWDFGKILSNYMSGMGDDPTQFVRPGVDWFHSNGATYDPSDDSLIVSARESFLIKVDYDTQEIVWILGDPTKHWWSFPSLRAKALTVAAPGRYPIGQHSPSLTRDGLLMTFNNGFPSIFQPPGAPVGERVTYSAVSTYRIDAAARTATEVRRFDHGTTITSSFCSSAYDSADGSLLVNYSFASGGTASRLVGLNPAGDVVFDFQYASTNCDTSWNAVPIPLEELNFSG